MGMLMRGEETSPTWWRGAGKGGVALRAMCARSHERGEPMSDERRRGNSATAWRRGGNMEPHAGLGEWEESGGMGKKQELGQGHGH